MAQKELVRYTFVALIWFFLWSSAEARKEKSIPEQKAFPLHVLRFRPCPIFHDLQC